MGALARAPQFDSGGELGGVCNTRKACIFDLSPGVVGRVRKTLSRQALE